MRASSAATLMSLQLGMTIAGNAVLIVAAICVLVWWPLLRQGWAIAAGMPLGWIALAGSVAACAYRRVQLGRRLSANSVGLTGMTALVLLACTIRWLLPLPVFQLGPEGAVWGYRTLMLGWAAYAVLIVLATWWVASLRTLPEAEGPPQALVRAAAVWVRVSGVLAVLLGLKAALFPHGYDYQYRLWAAAAIAIASGAGATMAVWRRREGWAFSAALGVNLAASLVVWYFYSDARNFAEWWLRLLEANVIASAAVALAWLAAQRRLYQLRQFGLGETPLLATQVTLPAAGAIVVLAMPVASLVGTPAYLPAWLAQLSDAPGWLALLLAAAAAAWYVGRVLPSNLIHVLSGLALGIGVLVACHAGRVNSDPGTNNWLAYHVLTTAWASAALLVLGIARFAVPFVVPPLGGMAHTAPPQGGTTNSVVQGWVTAIGAAAVALAVMHAHADQAGAWWSIRAIVSISVAAGLLALWLRLPAYVFISGLLVNVAGMIGWMAWGPATLPSLVEVNVLCLAAGSAAWSLLEWSHRSGVPHGQFDGRPLPFAHLAAAAATALVSGLVAAGVTGELLLLPELRLDGSQMDWLAPGGGGGGGGRLPLGPEGAVRAGGAVFPGPFRGGHGAVRGGTGAADRLLVGGVRPAGIRPGRFRAWLAAAPHEAHRPPAAGAGCPGALAGGVVHRGPDGSAGDLRRAGGVGLARRGLRRNGRRGVHGAGGGPDGRRPGRAVAVRGGDFDGCPSPRRLAVPAAICVAPGGRALA